MNVFLDFGVVHRTRHTQKLLVQVAAKSLALLRSLTNKLPNITPHISAFLEPDKEAFLYSFVAKVIDGEMQIWRQLWGDVVQDNEPFFGCVDSVCLFINWLELAWHRNGLLVWHWFFEEALKVPLYRFQQAFFLWFTLLRKNWLDIRPMVDF